MVLVLHVSESTPAQTLKVPAQISSTPSTSLNNMKSNITKTAQSLPYQKQEWQLK